jgi:hypothetical protein
MSVALRLPSLPKLVAAACLLALCSVPALAVPAVTGFESLGYQNTLSSANRTQGWIFTALNAVAVTHLGIWDQAGDGLVAAHPVGIWDASGGLLGTVTVQAGTASAIAGSPTGGGSFRYEAVAPILLQSGATYTIGALFDSNDIFDFYPDDVFTNAAVAYGEERYGDEGAGFVFPTDTFGRWGLFGPNFQYVVLAISEPAAAGLFAAGLAGLAAGSRRQRAGSASAVFGAAKGSASISPA